MNFDFYQQCNNDPNADFLSTYRSVDDCLKIVLVVSGQNKLAWRPLVRCSNQAFRARKLCWAVSVVVAEPTLQ